MAATVTGTFLLLDRASGPMRRMEEQARKTDKAIRGAGDALDDIGTRDQLRGLENTDRQIRDLDRSATDFSGGRGGGGRMRTTFQGLGDDSDRLSTKLWRVGGALEGLKKIIGLMKLPLIVTAVGALVQAVGALAGAAVAATPALGQWVGVMVTLIPNLTRVTNLSAAALPVIGALGTTAAGAMFAFRGFGTAVAEGGKALKDLEPQARRVAELFRKTGKDFAQNIQRHASGEFFGKFNAGVVQQTLLASRTQTAARNVVGAGARAAGSAASIGAAGLTSPEMLANIERISKAARPIMDSLAVAFVNVANALSDIAVAALPMAKWLARIIQGWTQYGQRVAEASRGSGALAERFEDTMRVAKQFGRIFQNVWHTLKGIGQASRETGDSLWDAAERGSEAWKKATNSISGQQRMLDWFEHARETASTLWQTVKDLTSTLINIGRAAEDAGDQMWGMTKRWAEGWKKATGSVEVQTKLRVFFKNVIGPTRQIIGLFGDLGGAIMRLGAAPGFERTVATLRKAVEPLEKAFAVLGKDFGPAVADLIVQLSRLFETLAEVGGGALGRTLTLFVDILRVVLDIVDAVPGLNRVFGAAVTLTIIAGFRRMALELLAIANNARIAAAALAQMAVAGGAAGAASVAGRAAGAASPLLLPPAAAAAGGARGALSRGFSAGRAGNFAGGAALGRMGAIGAAMGRPVGMLGRGAAAAGKAVPALGMAGRGAMAVGSKALGLLGPVGWAIMGGMGLHSALGTEGGLDRKAQGFASGLTAGLIPKPRSEEEARAEGQVKATESLETTTQSITDLNATQLKLKEEILQADRWDAAEMEGMLSVAIQQEKAQRQMRQQRQLGKASEIMEGPEGLTKAFNVRRRASKDPAQAMKQTTDQMLGNLKDLRPKGQAALAQGYLGWAKEMEKQNPKLEGLAQEAEDAIVAKWKSMGKKVRVVNGQIVEMTRENWGTIKDALTSNAEQARQEVSKAFTDIQQTAKATLVAMGMDPGTAAKVISGMEKGHTEAEARVRAGGKAGGIDSARASAAGATGMRIGGSGMQDNVNIAPGHRAAPGELVVNRHTEQRINAALGGRTTLGRAVAGEGRRHADPAKATGRGSSWLTRHAQGGRVAEPPGDPGSEVVQAGYENAVGSFLRRYGMDLTQGYNPGGPSVSPGHTTLGVPPSLDVVPLDGNWGASFLSGLKWAERQGMTVGYGSRGVGQAWANHGEGNHAHIDWLGGGKGFGRLSGGGGGGGAARQISLDAPHSRAAGLMGVASQRAMNVMTKGAEDTINKKLRRRGGGMGAAAGGDVRTWLRQALQLTGQMSPSNLNSLYGRAMQESGGDPRAINDWDSNAASGTPSKGLLQTIDPTFNAYKMRGMSNIFNPVHNAVAAIRYMMARYGHIVGPGGGGYATGGRLPDFGGWFGQGGSITASRPTMIGIGDGGTETATVTKGGGGAGAGVVIKSIKIENHREGDIQEQLQREVGAAFRSLSTELRTRDAEDENAAL